jgi:hypothetical protein
MASAVTLIMVNLCWLWCLHVSFGRTPFFLAAPSVAGQCHCTRREKKCPTPQAAHPPYMFPSAYNILKVPSGTYLDWVGGEEFVATGRGATHNYVSDKVDYKTHEYFSMYQKYLQPLRDSGETYQMLEIGAGPAGGGRGYLLYKAYAPNIAYHCLEYRNQTDDVLQHNSFTIAEKKYLIDNVYIGDQHNPADLRAVHDKWGPFDIIIDDGSHQCAHQVQSFVHLFPLLQPGGVYIVEDLQSNFNQRFYCGEQKQKRRGTWLEVMKEMVTALHYHWWQPKEYGQVNFDKDFYLYEKTMDWVQTIDCDREICAVRKRKQPLVRSTQKKMDFGDPPRVVPM